MSTAKSRTGSDAWVSANSPSRTWADDTRLQLEKAGADTRYAYLYLKNPAPRNATIVSATLHLFGYSAPGVNATVSVQQLAAKFTASRVTYGNRPGTTGPAVAVTQTQDVDGKEWAFDVTGIVQRWCNGATNYGLALSTSSTAMHRIYGLRSGDFRPYLDVTWSDAPDAPDELSPAGGSAVSTAAPFVSFHYFDVSGAERMTSCQVQINGSNSWSAPSWDSGEVATSDPELDLSATSYPGLALGSTAWWRCRVKNASGVWSSWSDATTFTRTARGTLAITSPAANVINDATQEVLWSLSGATQTSWQITVWDDADPSTVLYDSHRRKGADSSFTLPKGVITTESVTYRMRVRVWDILNRAHRPNDPSHTEAVTTFKYSDDAGVPINHFTATADPNGLPHVILQWTRADAPDQFVVSRNGKFIDSCDPADLVQPDGSFKYTDKRAEPNTTLTYNVRARINGKLGASDSVTVRYDLADLWLVDPDAAATRLVPVAVKLSDCQFSMPEVSGTYQPVDGSTPVVFVQGQQGLTGTINGRIVGVPRTGITSHAAVADLFWMKARPENELRMSIGVQNLNVKIHNVTIAPLAVNDAAARAVSFDFVSLDGPRQ